MGNQGLICVLCKFGKENAKKRLEIFLENRLAVSDKVRTFASRLRASATTRVVICGNSSVGRA